MKVRCIRDTPNARRIHQLILNKIYEVTLNDTGGSYVILGEEWNVNRFEKLKDNDGDYEVPPVTIKSPTRGNNNEVDSQELMDFFSRPQPGNCKCGGPKAKCPYHKDQT